MTELEPIDIMYDEAIAKQRAGDTDAAIEMLRQLLAQNPNYMLAHNALGVLYNRLGKTDQAIEHASRVCEIEPEDNFGYAILSTLCLKSGRREEAEDALMKASQIRHAAWLKSVQERQRQEQAESESQEKNID